MPPYVVRTTVVSRATSVLSRLSSPAIRLAHTKRRTLPEFSLEGKVAVGKERLGTLHYT